MTKSCYTHSYVGFCNQKDELGNRIYEVVIPTHMWASATPKFNRTRDANGVVIPTHMWASATY